MSETHELRNLVIFLGLVFLLMSTLVQPFVYIGQPLPANSPWTQFSNLVQNPPVFQNPFAVNSISTFIQPVGSPFGSWGGGQVGCTNNHIYNCVNTNDGNKSYLTMTTTFSSLTLNMSSYYQATEVINLRFNIWCQSSFAAANQIFKIFIVHYITDDSYNFTCPQGTGNNFGEVSLTLNPLCTGLPANTYCAWTQAALNNTQIVIQGQPNTGTVLGSTNITYAMLQITFNNVPACNGGLFTDFGCNIGKFLRATFNTIIFIVNGLVFIGQILYWFGSLVADFFSALGTLFAVSGMPPIAQAVISILVIGAMLTVSLTIMGKLRGTGNAG